MLNGQPTHSRFEELYKKNQEKQGRLKQIRDENEKSDIEAHQFKPAINEKSRQIYQHKLL